MIRDKKFILDSIKMDLYRVVHAIGDLTKEIPLESVKIFLNHAYTDFIKIEKLSDTETGFKNTIKNIENGLDNLKDPHKRLRLAEEILTIRCRL